MRPARTRTRSRRSPGCCSTKSRRTRPRHARWSTSCAGRSPTDRSSRPSSGYAPLPQQVVDLELKALEQIKVAVDGRRTLRNARPDELVFRAGTGVFAVLLIAIVAAIGFELFSESRLSIQEFGWQFWQTDIWDPVAGEFGARPFIWGTLYSSVLALLISTPIALGIAIYISELAPGGAAAAARLPDRAARGDPVDRLRPVGHLRARAVRARSSRSLTPEWLRAVPLFTGPPLGVGMLSAALILAIMVIPFSSSVAREVLQGGAAGAARRRLRARRDALGSDPHGAVLRAHRHRRRGHARLRPRARRDHGGDDGDRQQPADSASLFAPQYTMAAVLANEFAEATDDLYLHALIEIGLVLFVITLIINVDLAACSSGRWAGRSGRGRC